MNSSYFTTVPRCDTVVHTFVFRVGHAYILSQCPELRPAFERRLDENRVLHLFDRPLLDTVIVKKKNPFHKASTVFILSLCGSAMFLFLISDFLFD